MKLFLFFKTSTGKLWSQNIFECTYVHTYVTVRMDEHKITSERVYYRKKYGAIGTWIDDNLYNFCFKNMEQSHQVSSNSSIGVIFPLTVYIFFELAVLNILGH